MITHDIMDFKLQNVIHEKENGSAMTTVYKGNIQNISNMLVNIEEIHLRDIPEKYIHIDWISYDIKTYTVIKHNIVRKYNIHKKCIDMNNFNM